MRDKSQKEKIVIARFTCPPKPWRRWIRAIHNKAKWITRTSRVMTALFFLSLLPAPAHAACSNNEDGNAGVAGEVEYFSADGMLRYCDGTNWIDMVVSSDLENGLLAHYKLDETTGTTAVDSESGYNGTMYNGLSASSNSVNAPILGGLEFDGSDDLISISNNFVTRDKGSVSVWANPDVGADGYIVMGSRQSQRIYVRIDSGNLTLNFNGDGNQDTGFALPEEKWSHLTVTWNSGENKTYLNGTLIHTGTHTAMTNTACPSIGAYTSSCGATTGNGNFDGKLDDVRFYNRAITPQEVTLLYEMGADYTEYTELDFDDPAYGMVAHWKMDESGNTSTAENVIDPGTNDGALADFPADPSAEWEAGLYGNALDFSGANDYSVNAGSSTDFDIAEGAVSLWFYTPNATDTNHRFLFSKDQSGRNNGDFHLRVQESDDGFGNQNKILFYTDDGTTDTLIYSDGAISASTWTHVVVNYGTGGMEMYVNGTLQAQTDAVTNGMTNTFPDVIIGNLRSGGTSGFDGLIDDVRVYDRVLTQTEISELYSISTDPCLPANSPSPGDTCDDGSIYAGDTPDGSVEMFVTPFDAPSQLPWNNGNGSDYTDLGVLDTVTGEANTGTIVISDSDSSTGAIEPHQAAQYCYDLNAHGHSDWYLPAQDELKLVYDNLVDQDGDSTPGGPLGSTFNFTTSGIAADLQYSTSTEDSGDSRRIEIIYMETGSSGHTFKERPRSFRCARKEYELPNYLVGHWKLDETSGTTAYDSSGYGNDGTMDDDLSASEDSVSGIFSKGLYFDGDDDRIAVLGDPEVLRMNQDKSMSFSAWVKPVTTGNIVRYHDYDTHDGDSGGGSTGLYVFRVGSNYKLDFTFGPNPGYISLSSANNVVTAGEWAHVVAVRDVESDEALIYLNGNLLTSTTDTTTGTWESDGQYLSIGAYRHNTVHENLDGTLDDVRIYNKALSSSEIAALYNQYADRTELVGHWKLDETSGTTAYDSSGYGNHASFQNGNTWDDISASGMVKNSMLLDKTSPADWLNAPAADSINNIFMGNGGTNAFWINFDFIGTSPTRFISKSTNIWNWFGDKSSPTTIELSFHQAFDTTDGNWAIDAPNHFAFNTWHHVAVVYDCSDVNNDPIIYLDGSPVAITEQSTPVGTCRDDSPNPLGIGAVYNGQRQHDGHLDDVRLYNGMLDADDIAALYAMGQNTDSGLVGHWKLDEISGTTIYDSSGNGNHASIPVDASTLTASDGLGNYLNFDGTSYVTIPHQDAYNIQSTHPVTLALWIKKPIGSGTGNAFRKKDGTGPGYYGLFQVFAEDSGRIQARTKHDGGSTDFNPNIGNMYTGNWRHLACVYDGVALEKRCYLDGQQEESTRTLSGTDSYENTEDLLIMNSAEGGARDVRMYNRALSENEIYVLAHCTGPGTQYYNFTDDAMQWCDGVNSAYDMGPAASGSGGCSPEGALRYDTDRYQFCEGNGWVDVGK